MTNLEQILTIVAASTPSIVTLITSIVLTIINKLTIKSVITKIESVNASFEEVKTEVKNSKEYADLKAQLSLVQHENYVLKQKINELLTKIDKVVRNEDEQTNQTM